MDKISSISSVKDALNGRNSNPRGGQFMQRNSPKEAIREQNKPTEPSDHHTEKDSRLGQKIDITV